MFTFDPWQLLGLKTTSTLDEARRAYYKLAVIMHPDKGGDAEDMRVLYEAYKWIYQQLQGASFPITVDDPSKTPIIDTVMGMDRASLEVCYEKLRPNETNEHMKLVALDWVKYLVERDLMKDALLKSIEEYVQEGIEVVLKANDQEGWSHATVSDGYGGQMDTSENIGENIAEDMQYMSIHEKITAHEHRFTKELAIYEEPICPMEIFAPQNPVEIPKKLDDYSDKTEGLIMTDYALAHSVHIISDPEAYQKEKEQSEKERAEKS